MQISHTSNKHQHNRVKAFRENSNSYSFFNLLTSDELLDNGKPGSERIFR